MKTYVCFVVAGDIKWPQKHSVTSEWYQAVGIAEELQILHRILQY